jgi:ABC-2 type transport system permease protein
LRQLISAIVISARFQMRNSMARAMMQFVVLVQPLILTTITHLMYVRSGLEGYRGFVVVGTSVATLWMITLWSSATDINRERSMGTLPFLLISPTPFPIVLAGKVLGNTLLGVCSVLLTFSYSGLVLGIRISIANPVFLLMALSAAVCQRPFKSPHFRPNFFPTSFVVR